MQDFFFGLRILWKSKGFAAAALLTLALGIGANSAIFSIVDAILIRPLPYPNSNRLVTLWERRPDVPRNLVTGPDFRDWRDQAHSYDAMAALTPDSFNVTSSGSLTSFDGLRVSADFLRVIGVQPALGRSFLPQEEIIGQNHVAVISHRLWESAFAGSTHTIGKHITLNDGVYTIVGIMPSSFKFLDFKSDLWVPLSPDEANDRHAHTLIVIARLKNQRTVAEAASELSGIAAQLARQYPNTNAGWTVNVLPLRDQIVGSVRTGILILLGAVGLVLLIACANSANLLLVRAAGRRREMGIRLALGASPARITRQVLTESVLLAIMGGTLGLSLAWAAIQSVRALNPGNLPRIDEVQLNANVLWFTLFVSCLAGILFGLLPALQSRRYDIVESLREGARGIAGGVRSGKTRGVLVASEVALSLVLLVAASLLLRSLMALTEADLGFRPDHLLTLTIRVAEQQYSSEQQESADFERTVDGLQALPGVACAAAGTNLPSLGWNQGRKFEILGRPWPDGEIHGAGYLSVSPTYFSCAGSHLIKGRFFTPADRHGSQEVIIISEAFAKRYFPHQNPIGHQISCYSRAFKANRFGPAIPRTIIGIVSDVRHLEDVGSEASVEMYTPQMQNTLPFSYFLVRTFSYPALSLKAVRHTVNEVLPNAPVSNLVTMETLLGAAVARPRFNTFLLGAFATIALLLAATGIYGVVAYSVQQRIREVGIRMAIGATRTEILGLFLTQGLKPALFGASVGLIVSFALAHVLSDLVYGVTVHDPITFLLTPVILIASAGIASLIPAFRATRVDPVSALRSE